MNVTDDATLSKKIQPIRVIFGLFPADVCKMYGTRHPRISREPSHQPSLVLKIHKDVGESRPDFVGKGDVMRLIVPNGGVFSIQRTSVRPAGSQHVTLVQLDRQLARLSACSSETQQQDI